VKLSTTLAASFAVLALGAWGVSMACDHDKKIQTSAASASAAKTECTAAQAAACKAKGTSATTASTASSCAAHKATATSASAVTASSDGCAHHKDAAASASAGGSCAAHKTASAMASGAACNHGDATSAMAKSGVCSGKGMTTAVATTAHGDCDACADMQMCAQELEAAGAHTQIVPLKNGVMFVYTADSPGQVRAVQAAMVRRGEKIGQLVSAGDKAHLCAECKQIRGAMASGKLNREVVNIEGGSLTLMTSNDPKMVSKIHSMVDVRMAARTKS
jgi:hypothetical protein